MGIRSLAGTLLVLSAATWASGVVVVDAGVGAPGYDGFSAVYEAAIAQGFTLGAPVWNADVQALCKAGDYLNAPADISRFHLVAGMTPSGAAVDEQLVNLGNDNRSIYRTIFHRGYLPSGTIFW